MHFINTNVLDSLRIVAYHACSNLTHLSGRSAIVAPTMHSFILSQTRTSPLASPAASPFFTHQSASARRRAAHLHCAEAINLNTSLCHPKVLNASHATHSRHGYATRQSNGNAALAKKRGPEGFLRNQSTARQREKLRSHNHAKPHSVRRS
jgi:hypothetical protein